MFLSRILATTLAAVALSLAAPAAAQDLPGFGDSTAMPTGTPLKLPEGLELTIVSYNSFDLENTCKRPDAPAAEAPNAESGLNGGLVRVCFQFSNKTREPINVDLPPGLIVVSSSDDTQHGMFFQKLNLEVPAEQDLYAPTKGDCMNVSRSAPGVGVPYELGPVTDSRDIREALSLMAGANLSDPLVAATASMIMKPLYRGKPLTNEARRELMTLPRR